MSDNELKRTPLFQQQENNQVNDGYVIRGAMARISVFKRSDAMETSLIITGQQLLSRLMK